MTLACIGRFHFFEQARALAAANALDRCVCDDPRVLTAVGAARGRWLVRAGLVARALPGRASRMLSWRGEQIARASAASRLVKINSAFALETIRRGAAGAVWVDHGSLDERCVAGRMQEEAELWGDPLAAAGGNHGSPYLVDRQAEEFATAAGVVVASHVAARSAIRYGVAPDRLRVVPLGVDAARFRPRPADAVGRAPGRFRILHAGPVNFNKGVHRLIAAFGAARLPQAELCIVGPFPNELVRESLMRQAAAVRSAGGSVEFLPPVRQAQLPGLFAESDLFVLASLADGFGLTVLQAMACRLPAVVTADCGCHEVLSGCPAARVVPSGDTLALAAALAEAYAQRADQAELGRAARDWVLRLDWPAHAARLRAALGDHCPPHPARLVPKAAAS